MQILTDAQFVNWEIIFFPFFAIESFIDDADDDDCDDDDDDGDDDDEHNDDYDEGNGSNDADGAATRWS